VNLTRAPRSYLSIANTRRPGEVMGIVINKVLADFDLRTWRARSGPR
jgi:hypothetical protein